MDSPRAFGMNQIRILHALMEGPLLGLYHGPRSVVNVMDNPVPWMAKTHRRGKYSKVQSTMETRAYNAMRRLVKDGYITREKQLVNTKGELSNAGSGTALRNRYTVTEKGIEEYRKQTDPAYRTELVRRERAEIKRRTATHLRWNQSHDPDLRWQRWYAVKGKWRALVEKHPVDGWRYQIVTPDGATSAWKVSDKQEKAGTLRKAEATVAHFEKMAADNKEESKL